MAPDIAIVGEVRDREALPLLLTLSSGVKGLATIHAGSARQALSRLRFVCQLADVQLPLSGLNSLVTESIDLVVHCERRADRVRVTEIICVEDQQTGPDATAFTTTSLFSRQAYDAPLLWSGNLPVRLTTSFGLAGLSVRDLLDEAPQRVRV
jgi:pilus assembly protein CpaF